MYCKRSNQYNFAQLLANIHDTSDMRVPKTLTMTRKNKQKIRDKLETRGKQQQEVKMSGKCILNS